MVRALLLAAAALLLAAAARPPRVDYRLGVEAVAGGPPLLTVEMRLRGDADGETRLAVPAGLTAEPEVAGASLETSSPANRLLRHGPAARLMVRYRLYATASPDGLAALGEQVFAVPDGRAGEAAAFRWSRLPQGWRAATDLEHGARGQAMTVGDVARSVILAGPRLETAERALSNGTLRAAVLAGDPARARTLADTAAPVIEAERAYWGDETGPFLVAEGPFVTPADRGDAVALPPLAGADLRDAIATAHMQAWIPGRTGRTPTPAAWFTDDFARLFADRALLRAGLLTPDSAVGRLGAADRADNPGLALALKWDDEIRRKTAGRADLDDALLRMRDHYRQFAPGQGPDVVTGLVSAAWVVAGLDLRPDIARYGSGGAAVPLPETLFGGCLDARVVVSPGFDAGFDTTASFSSRTLTGVRRRGPAWNSGLRDGMTLDAWTFTPGDMTREVVLTVRDGKRRKPRTLRYWPYGDADVETRKLRLPSTLSGEPLAACSRKIAGL